MELLTPNQLKAANAIWEQVGKAYEVKITGRGSWTIASQSDVKRANPNISDEDLIITAKSIESSGFIRIEAFNSDFRYRLEQKGILFLESRKNYEDYLREEIEKEVEQIRKDKRDEEIKDLQLKDYRDKVHDLNPAQSSVLRGTWERHKQTIMLGIIVALIAATVTIMVKIWGH